MITVQDVLGEFQDWIGEQPDTPARRWVQENPPVPADAVRVLAVFKMSLELTA